MLITLLFFLILLQSLRLHLLTTFIENLSRSNERRWREQAHTNTTFTRKRTPRKPETGHV